jgi:hypothetical protein
MSINRNQIIESIKKGLINDSRVYAFWLEGADAHNRVDKYSDIDIWLDVEDDGIDKIIKKLKLILVKISPIDFEYEKNHPHPKIRQIFFHLKGSSEFLIIDVCIQKHSREFWYTHEFVDEKAKIIFEKEKVVKYHCLNRKEFEKNLKDSVNKIEKRYLFFQAWIKKAAKRNNFLEALEYYYKYCLEPLVELLRIRWSPTKKDFNLKDIKKDLPKNIIAELEDLYKINSISEINIKLKKANLLFKKNLKSL